VRSTLLKASEWLLVGEKKLSDQPRVVLDMFCAVIEPQTSEAQDKI
jgi:hypothetical protein